ncbi:hypothetical protein [Maribacter sp. IgM3_T14_3]|uniref:hypothetical protein n=1 Tax=Maribacter sp. IgM3_T14_3 TaxID=3415140 RepID=UPI003C6FF8FB
MKKIILLAITIINSVVLFSQNDINNQLSTEHKSVDGTKISIVPPNGFTTASNFLGFQQTQSGSSIMVLDIPGPFSEVSKGLTKEGLLSQGMTLKETHKLTLNSLPAVLLKAEQNAYGNIYTKYILAFGTEEESILINGTFPQNIEDLNEVLKKALLSTVYDSNKKINPFDTVDFEISTDGTDIVFAKNISNSLIFNRDGKIPSETKDKVSLIIVKAFSNVDIMDKKLFAMNRIRQLPIVIKKIISTEPIEIDGINGYEIIADGSDKKTGNKEKAYQVILFSDSLYYLIFGSSQADFDNNIELFKKLAKTFKRK